MAKWILIEPQFNIMPVLNGLPLNGVEFQQAIYTNDPHLRLANKQGVLTPGEAAAYLNWIGKYLFYFDVLFDQETQQGDDFKTIEGKTKLTLVPVGCKEPRIFQRRYPINYSHYTHSLNDFYR